VRLAVALLALAVLAPSTAHARPAPVELGLFYAPGTDGPVYRAHLSCHGTAARRTGYLRGSAAKLCVKARGLARFLDAPPDPYRPCAELYGGPQRGRVRGRIGAVSVDRTFSRVDGCAIGDWDRMVPLLPRTRGAVIA
jgi:hypothetical protein